MGTGIVQSSTRSDVDDASDVLEATIDTGGGVNVTTEQYAAPGVDSRPVAGDHVATVPGPGAGNELAVGYLDPAGGLAGAGEIRTYARDGDGVIASVHIRADGAIVIENREGGLIEMASDGVVTINGVMIDLDGNVSAPGEVSAQASATPVALSTHTHLTAMGPTDPPTAGT